MTKQAFGIDLGTTYSSICFFHYLPEQLRFQIDIIRDMKSKSSVPSKVYYQEENGQVIPKAVGNGTTDYQDQPEYLIYDSKIMLGQNYYDSNIQKMKNKWPFKIKRGKHNSILIYFKQFQNQTYPPYKVSGDILKYLKKKGNKRFSDENGINNVVITIPANFGDAQRSETLKAAKYAGLKVLRLINEPTAAAIAYGVLRGESFKSCLALIFDFGGGTLDVSLLSIKNNTLKVIGTNGDMHLGGRDFDERTAEYLINEMQIQDEQLKIQTLEAAQEAKEKLSEDDINEAIVRIGSKKHKLTLKKFEEVNQDLIDRILIPVEKVLTQTITSKEQVDKIILVGGSSYMKFVEKKLTEFFGKKPYNAIDPLDAVVIGASIVATKIVNGEKLPKMISEIKFFDICPFSLGTMLYDGSFDILIEKGVPVPKQRFEPYHTIFYRQESFTVDIYEGEKENPKNNRFLGSFTLKLPISEKFIYFIISFDLNENCILSASAKIVNSDKYAGTIIDITKTNDNVHVIEKLRDEELLSQNITRFITLNIDNFNTVYKKYEIEDMLEEAEKIKDQHLDKTILREIAKEWRTIKFNDYFKKFNANCDDNIPDFLFI